MALFKKHLNSASITTYDAIIKVCINDTIDGNPSYYALQRMATAFKKNKQMDLAIACLRRSNELSDAYDKPPLLEKDYLRLIKFLQQNNENDVAELEFKNICKRHPEFADKRISNLLRINEELKKYSEKLATRKQILVANKIDVMQDDERLKELEELAKKENLELFKISGVTGEGVSELLNRVSEVLKTLPKEEIVEEPQEDDFDDEDDDFDDDTEDDDFDTDEDDVKSSDREYVSIPRDNSKEEAASDYKVNVDVSIDTTGFKADDDTDSEDDVEAEETVNDVEAKDTSVKEAVAKADTEE